MKTPAFLKRFGKFELILLWLAIEYITSIHLGKILAGTDWIRWAQFTGYGGVSLWILVSALLFYYAVLRNGLKWPFAALLVIVILAPILYSYSLRFEPSLETYDEVVARTAAWISVLILISAVVKELIRKK